MFFHNGIGQKLWKIQYNVPIGRHSSGTHTSLLWSHPEALTDAQSQGTKFANRTKWEKRGNFLTCALRGHLHSEASVYFTGYFLQPWWEIGSEEGQFPKSTTTSQEGNPGGFFSSSHRFILFLQLFVMQIRVIISTYVYSTIYFHRNMFSLLNTFIRTHLLLARVKL